MAPTAFLAHGSSGRVRIRVPSRRGDAAYFERIRDSFAQCPGVRHLDVNPMTGSILLHHGLELEEVVCFGESNRLFEIERAPARGASPLSRLAQEFGRLDARISASTGGMLDLPTIAFAACLGGVVIQMGRGRALAPASTLAWYAASLLLLARALPDRTLRPLVG
jgi:hypothetical protein